MAGRLVMGQTREGHWGTLRVDDLGVLVEKYSTQGQYSLGRQHYTVSGGVELYAIDEEHICFLYGNNLGADNADDVVLTKTGMDTFSAHFGAPGRVPWNGMCTTAQSDISVQVNDGTIRVMIAAKCSDQFVDSAKMEQTGAFSFAMTGMRPPHACGIR